jgi:hypothetical protein
VGNITVQLSGIELYLPSGVFLPCLSPVTGQHQDSGGSVHPADTTSTNREKTDLDMKYGDSTTI